MSDQTPVIRRECADAAGPPIEGLPDAPDDLLSGRLARSGDNATLPGVWLQWLVTAALSLIVLTLAAAYAPKMVALFLIGYGLAAGAILGWLARLSGLRGLPLVMSCALLIAIGSVGLTVRSHQLWGKRTLALLKETNGLSPFPSLGLLEGLPSDIRSGFQRALATRSPRMDFPAYLHDRLTPLGDWPPPWPALFWGAEIAIGTVAGAWLAGRLVNPPALNEHTSDG